MNHLGAWLVVVLLVGAAGCVESGGSAPEGSGELPCGVRVCTAPESDGEFGPDNVGRRGAGKADTESVQSAINALSADGVLDGDDITEIFGEIGDRLSLNEAKAIRESLDSTDYEVTEDAVSTAHRLAMIAELPDDEAQALLDGISFAGTEVPPAVTELIARARLHGAVAFDVTEVDDDGEGVWTPYPVTVAPYENMIFGYTEITPAALKADLEDTDVVYNAIVGTETLMHPSGVEYEAARYEERRGGTGNILSHYDEVYHPDIYARGRSGQKWANNVAILSDGTFHCLPASRRSFQQNIILTNPSLSRGRRLLYNGHLDVRDGVVVGIEMSGRLSKLAAKGEANFVDPIALLEAWGFEISPGVRLRYGNTRHGVPLRENGVITSQDG